MLVQLTFWRLYHTPLTALQVAGIGLTLIGTVIATGTGTGSREPGAAAPGREEAP